MRLQRAEGAHVRILAFAVLFMLKVNNFLQYGAELKWLSAFPGESEYLFPPLTYLAPTGRRETVRVDESEFTVVEVAPHFPS